MNEVGWRRGMFIRSKSHEEEEELFVFNFTTAGGSIQPGFNKRVVRSAVAVYRTLVSTREISSLSPIESTDTESSQKSCLQFLYRDLETVTGTGTVTVLRVLEKYQG
jgi:hypothetical protein